MIPAALASSRAGLRADGSFGLKTIASTPAAMRSRMSWSCPAASVLRWIVVELRDLARRQGLGLRRADLLLAEAVADAAAVRVADLVLRGGLARRLAGRRARGLAGRGARGRRRGRGDRRGRGGTAARARADDDRDRGRSRRGSSPFGFDSCAKSPPPLPGRPPSIGRRSSSVPRRCSLRHPPPRWSIARASRRACSR